MLLWNLLKNMLALVQAFLSAEEVEVKAVAKKALANLKKKPAPKKKG